MTRIDGNDRILIIDDEPDFVEALKMALEAKSYRVAVASSQEQGEEMVADSDVVVLGTMVPVGQAFSMHRWLKAHPKHGDIPLLVVDAPQGERQTRGWRVFEGMLLEAEEYATKPLEPASLVPLIQSLCGGVKQRTRTPVGRYRVMVGR